MSGYVRIHRTLIGHPAFRNDAEAMAFAWMVAKAQWKATRVRYKGRAISLERGQLAVSQRDMAHDLDRDKAWIERLWKRLKGEAMIEVTCEAGVAVITICNYGQYQSDSTVGEAVNEAYRKADARQTQGTEQRREEGKKEVVGRTPAKTCLPDNWEAPPVSELTPNAQKLARDWTPASYAAVAEAFTCYWRRTGRMNKDWRLTWCEWVIKEHSKVMRDQKFGNAPTDKPEKVELTAQQWRERAEQLARFGQHDNAEECRRKAIALEQRQAA